MRSDRHLARAALLACALAAGCGDFVESNGEVVRATLGDAGGALRLESFSLDVPAHALPHTTTLTVSRASVAAPDGPAFVVEPAGAVFAVPATVTITYDAAVYPHPVEVLVAMYTGTTWHSMPLAGTAQGGVARATTTHTGTFGIAHCPGGICP